MLDGRPLVDAHLHVPVLGSLAPAWLQWAGGFGDPEVMARVWDDDGRPRPAALDELLAAEGVDVALLLCEYSPRVTGYQRFEDLLPLVAQNPQRFRPVANVNPHLHYPAHVELARQLDAGAVALKLHPVHGGFRIDDPGLFGCYATLLERDLPLVVHCGTSSFPGSMNELADPVLLAPLLRHFPGLQLVLAHGGRGWWYDAAAFLALAHDNVWIELSGLPPKRIPSYYQRHDLTRLARRFVFATDWPGVPGVARNARAVAGLGLPEETIRLALGGNAARIYHLDLPEPITEPRGSS